jgi:hypothetical protein
MSTTPTQYAYYKYNVNGKDYVAADPSGKIPTGVGGSAIDYNTFVTMAKDPSIYFGSQPGQDTQYDVLMRQDPKAFQQGGSTGYSSVDGVLTMNSTLAQQTAIKDGVASGSLIDIGNGKYIPKGSAAAAYQQNPLAYQTARPEFNLPTATAPTTASGVKSSPGVNVPFGTPTTGNISNALASTTGSQQYFDTLTQASVDRAAKEQSLRDAISKTTSGQAEQSLLSKLLNSKSPEQIRSDAMAQTGITPANYFADEKAKIAEINSLTEEYNALKASKEAQIASSYDKLGSNNFINNQIAQIERNAAPKLNQLSANINAKAATLQALQGSFREAQNFINQAVQDATADLRYTADLYSLFKTQNEKLFEQMDAPYKEAYETAQFIAKTDYERAYQDKTRVGELMINNPQAGISITDTYDQALTKIQAKPMVEKPNIEGSAATGYFYMKYDPTTNSYKKVSVSAPTGDGGGTPGGYKFTNTQLNSGAASAGLTLDSFKALNGDLQNYFINAPQKQLDAMREAVANGDTELIDSSVFPQPVKDYFKSQIVAPSTKSGSGIWGNIKNFFQNTLFEGPIKG